MSPLLAYSNKIQGFNFFFSQLKFGFLRIQSERLTLFLVPVFPLVCCFCNVNVDPDNSVSNLKKNVSPQFESFCHISYQKRGNPSKTDSITNYTSQ